MTVARERWVLVFELLSDSAPAETRVRILLKIARRRLRLKCVRVGDDEVRRLQRIIEGLCARVAAQAELLSQRAERTKA